MPKTKSKPNTTASATPVTEKKTPRSRRNRAVAAKSPERLRLEQTLRDVSDAIFDLAEAEAVPAADKRSVRRVRRAIDTKTQPEFDDLMVTAETLAGAFRDELGFARAFSSLVGEIGLHFAQLAVPAMPPSPFESSRRRTHADEIRVIPCPRGRHPHARGLEFDYLA